MQVLLTAYVIIIGNTLAMIDVWLLLKILFGCDLKLNRKSMLISAGGFMITDIILILLFYNQDTLMLTGMFAYVVIATFILTKSGRLRAALYALPAILVYLQFDSLLNLIEMLFHLDRFYIIYDGSEGKLTPLRAFSEIILFIILILLDKHTRKKNMNVRLSGVEAVCISIFCIFCPIIEETFSYLEQREAGFAIGLQWTVFMIALNLLFVFVIVHRKRAVYYRAVSKDNSNKFNDEYSAFKEYQNKNEETAKFRHDMNNHMIILQQMMKEHRYDDAQTYFEEISSSVGTSTIRLLTGNEMLDMILGTKYEQLQEKNIEIRADGKAEGLTFISPADLCIIFSNLIDNAIEAVEKLPDHRWIEILCKRTEGTIFIEIKNPVREDVQLRDGRPVTTKEDSKNHGLGLINVEDTVKKYGGYCRIELSDHCFSYQMVIPSV